MKQYLELLEDILENGVESEDRTGTGTLSVFGRMLRFDLSKGYPLLTTKDTHFKSVAIELLWFLSGDTNTKFLTDNGVRIWNEWAEKEDTYTESDLSDPDRVDLAVMGGYFHGTRNELVKVLQQFTCMEEGHAYLDEIDVPRTKKLYVRRKGDLGPLYGEQWRAWGGPNGIKIDQIKNVIESIKNDPYSRRHIVSAWNVGYLDQMNLFPCHYVFQFYVRDGKLSCMFNMR